jgi:cellulose synthase/poly-beta-1,6-N-acetylglucosamine synthase-like glycosyltransferase
MVGTALAATVMAALGLVAMMTLSRCRVARWPLGGVAGVLSAGVASLAATPGTAGQMVVLFLALALSTLALQRPFRRIWWPGRLFLAGLLIASITYVAALVRFTFFGGLPPLGLGLSVFLLILELLAIALSIGFGYELADALAREAPDPIRPAGYDIYRPRVCLQVPAYNEPPELLRETLEALARLDYPHYIVQVVVNNTSDPALWQPVAAACDELGPRFQFIHLPNWPGFKAGALNEATRRLPAGVEVVGIVDADYVVRPDFLAACLPYLADPMVAFVQTPQHYRDWRDSGYLRGLFHAYRYFFDVTMVARSRVNAIIFGGTMGLIRLSALKEIGGWAEWCITEDAEASLRLLARGWKSVYVNRPFGEGLMPLDFDGLRRQRFRWAFGGIQILRRHMQLMLGLRSSRLTLAQRYHYLMGALGWFGEPVSVALGFFLLLATPFLVLGHPLLIRQLAGVILVMPLFLLVAGLSRLGWGLKVATGARWRDVPSAMMVMLALSWTVSRACVHGLVRGRGVFLRTPKVRTPSKLGRALVSTWFESVLSLAFLVAAPLLLVLGPRPLGPAIALMLVWQAFAWGSAPAASLAAQGIRLTPSRVTFRRSPQNTGLRSWPWPAESRRLVLVAALALAAFLLVPALVTGGGDDRILTQLGLPAPQPITVLAHGGAPAPGRSPSAPGRASSGSPATGATSPSGRPSPSPGAKPSSTPRATTTASPQPSTRPTPSAVPTPSALPTPSSLPTTGPSVHPTPSPRSLL